MATATSRERASESGVLEALRPGDEVREVELCNRARSRGVRMGHRDIADLVAEGFLEWRGQGTVRVVEPLAPPEVETKGAEEVDVVDLSGAEPGARRSWTRAGVLAAVRRYAALMGEPPAKAHWNAALLADRAARSREAARRAERRLLIYALGSWPCETTVRKLCGSMPRALADAGFTPRANGRPRLSSVKLPDRQTGRAGLQAAQERVTAARELGDERELEDALRELAAIALIEAEQLEEVDS
jgi:hypothetical protein